MILCKPSAAHPESKVSSGDSYTISVIRSCRACEGGTSEYNQVGIQTEGKAGRTDAMADFWSVVISTSDSKKKRREISTRKT